MCYIPFVTESYVQGYTGVQEHLILQNTVRMQKQVLKSTGLPKHRGVEAGKKWEKETRRTEDKLYCDKFLPANIYKDIGSIQLEVNYLIQL